DMQMGAISKYYTLKQTVIQSIKAGNDILIFSQFFKPDLLLIDQVTDIIKTAIKSGEITEARIDQSFARIMKLKSKI
ncbi:MAG TPA: glycoside hydrolase family 3 N-terminal domain-containing protein, partial [Candidatus Cloacimonadota bacterium]|nr:glycoside hydrolase family 3 N-terminal domain-containing protein [Candidatus Cloacimonadota bacterium]